MEEIAEGFDVFLHNGEKSFGAVRQLLPQAIVIYVENAGDFEVPRAAVKEVYAEKVILDPGHLPQKLRDAIGKAHAGERPSFPENV